MPYAICTECGQAMHWRNTRGSRIADMRCTCGGRLRAAKWQDGRIVPRPQKSVAAGKTYRICAVCERRRLDTKVIDGPHQREYWRDPETPLGYKILRTAPEIYPAGSVVCPRCRQYLVPSEEVS